MGAEAAPKCSGGGGTARRHLFAGQHGGHAFHPVAADGRRPARGGRVADAAGDGGCRRSPAAAAGLERTGVAAAGGPDGVASHAQATTAMRQQRGHPVVCHNSENSVMICAFCGRVERRIQPPLCNMSIAPMSDQARLCCCRRCGR